MDKEKKLYLRIKSIRLRNFRNIEDGKVELPNGKLSDYLEETPSILGLYGQNGSGKTSLILAISLLKTVGMGLPVKPKHYMSCIREGCEACSLEFEFSVYSDHNETYEVFYSFDLRKELDPSVYSEEDNSFTMTHLSQKDPAEKLRIENEVLRVRPTDSNGNKYKIQTIVDTTPKACKNKNAFGDEAVYNSCLTNCTDGDEKQLSDWKTEARIQSESFIFYRPVFIWMLKNQKKICYLDVLAAIKSFCHAYLHIISTEETARVNHKDIVLLGWEQTEHGVSLIQFSIPEDEIPTIQIEGYKAFMNAITGINSVLCKLIPGLTVDVIDRGTHFDEKQREIKQFEMLSNRNGVRIPLGYESDGVRRIISFLSLIIALYNHKSITVAIDEIDSGIFEYLLGEILQILGESAKGQLIFTSHNLRPLEVLPSKYIRFTSVDPTRRFIKLPNVSGNNNLRDSYFRNIVLGDGTIYAPTDRYEIEQALFEAGADPEEMGDIE